MENNESKQFDRTRIDKNSAGQHQMFRRSKRGGDDFAKFNPSSEESIKSACSYVGSSKAEVARIIRYFNPMF